MARKIISADTLSKQKSAGKAKKKVDLHKVAKVISENKDTIETVAAGLGTLINSSSNSARKTTRKTTTKKTTRSSGKTTRRKKKTSNDMVSTLVDMFLNK